MKKTMLVMAMAIALAMSTMAGAFAEGYEDGPPPERVTVCHVTPGGSDPIPTFTPDTDPRVFYPGKLIEVAAPAVSAFEAQGGSTDYRDDEAGLANIRESAEDNGLNIWVKANCFVTG